MCVEMRSGMGTMPSKYDAFWVQQRAEVARLVREAAQNGRSSTLTVAGLTAHGSRRSWSGSVQVRGRRVEAYAAHAKALGRLLVQLNHEYPHIAFRAVVTKDLQLHIETVQPGSAPSASDAEQPDAGPPPQGAEGSGTAILATRAGARGNGSGTGGPGTGTAPPSSEPCGPDNDLARLIHQLTWQLPRVCCANLKATQLPGSGIYFVFQRGEGVPGGPRIVRIGINRKAARFRDRIRQHCRGNRRGSIFRLLLGDALLRSRRHDELCRQWQEREGPVMPEVEDEVSKQLADQFCFAYLEVEDDDERQTLETWLISCLARSDWAQPSPIWLGHHSSRPRVRESGLWNVQGVGSDTCRNRNRHLKRFRELVDATRAAWGGPAGRDEGAASGVLLIIPCSAGKRAAPTPLLPGAGRSIVDELTSTAADLARGRAGKEARLRRETPQRAALDYYDGHFYRVPGLRNRLAQLVRDGRAEVLILSGGYGALLADEPIHDYEAPLNASYWRRHRLPQVLADFIESRGFRRVHAFAAHSTGYASILKMVPWRHLAGRLDEAVLWSVESSGGGAMVAVPRALGHAARALIDAGFDRSEIPGQVLGRCQIIAEDLLGE